MQRHRLFCSHPPTRTAFGRNELLAQESANSMFVTAFYGIYNLTTGQVTYTNAGHNPPYLMKADGTVLQLPFSSDLVVGAIDDFKYSEETLQLEHGDTLLSSESRPAYPTLPVRQNRATTSPY